MKKAINQPATVDLCIYGGIYCKIYEVPDNGTIIPQHSHEFSHISMLARGAIRVWRDDGPARDYTAPATIKIPARTKHLFATLESHTVIACLHAAATLDDDAQPSVAEEHQLKLED